MVAQAQNGQPAPDESFEIFLLVIGSLFMCAMFAAAIIGALIAAFVLFAVLGLVALGILSTSFAIGIYKRSFHSGFKSLLILGFGLSCTVLGSAAGVAGHALLELPISRLSAGLYGGFGGMTGGILLALSTFKVYRWLLNKLIGRLGISN
jgi:hypothetical protein